MASPSHSPSSSSRSFDESSSSSSLSDDNSSAMFDVRRAIGGGLPDAMLSSIIAAVVRKMLQFLQHQHGGSRPGKRSNRDLGRAEAARRLHADYFFPVHEQNPYGGVGPTFTDAEFERLLRINPRVYARVKAGVLLLDECSVALGI
jgi:hypothetical protein